MSRKSITDLNASAMQAVPRSGGYVTIVNQSKSSKQGEKEKIECACDGAEKSRVPLAERTDKSDINFLSTIFSTVMLLASGLGPTDLQVEVTRAYLKCITDDDGNTPPNIQGLLNEIELQFGSGNDAPNNALGSNKSSRSRLSSGVTTPRE